GADDREPVVAPVARLRLGGEDVAQDGLLDLARRVRGRLEPGQPAADGEGRRLADHLLQHLEQGGADEAGDETGHDGCRGVGLWVGASSSPRCSSKKDSTRRRYSSPSTCSAWLCLAFSTSQNSLGSPAHSNSPRAISGLM